MAQPPKWSGQRHKDMNWVLPEMRDHQGVGGLSAEEIMVALLMDLRDELKEMNGLLRSVLAVRSRRGEFAEIGGKKPVHSARRNLVFFNAPHKE
jgi:hypothetical protein